MFSHFLFQWRKPNCTGLQVRANTSPWMSVDVWVLRGVVLIIRYDEGPLCSDSLTVSLWLICGQNWDFTVNPEGVVALRPHKDFVDFPSCVFVENFTVSSFRIHVFFFFNSLTHSQNRFWQTVRPFWKLLPPPQCLRFSTTETREPTVRLVAGILFIMFSIIVVTCVNMLTFANRHKTQRAVEGMSLVLQVFWS